MLFKENIINQPLYMYDIFKYRKNFKKYLKKYFVLK